MAASEITKYAAELGGLLAGVGANAAELGGLTTAATNLAALAGRAPGALTQAEWQTANDDWVAARDALGTKLAEALLGPLAGVPGLAELASDVAKLGGEGIHGGIDLGPVHLEVGSALLVIEPPKFAGAAGPSDAVAIGPYQIGEIAATMSSPPGKTARPYRNGLGCQSRLTPTDAARTSRPVESGRDRSAG